jgi:hypothetical protein
MSEFPLIDNKSAGSLKIIAIMRVTNDYQDLISIHEGKICEQ